MDSIKELLVLIKSYIVGASPDIINLKTYPFFL